MIEKKCHRCDHEWEYKGIKMYTNCPNCKTSVVIRSFEEFMELKNQIIGENE